MSTISIPANKLDKKQLEAIKAFLNALKIKFELTSDKIDTKSIAKQKELISLTAQQKSILDARRATTKKSDYIPWEKAKKQLKFKGK
jgi:hypothetical protein